jgi:hypothetical protein
MIPLNEFTPGYVGIKKAPVNMGDFTHVNSSRTVHDLAESGLSSGR